MRFSFITLSLCLFCMCGTTQNHDHIRLVAEMNEKFEAKVFSNYGVKAITTHGNLSKNIASLGMRFEKKGPVSKDELRKLVIEMTTLYLEEINNNPELEKYMKTFPFLPENVHIAIFIKDNENKPVYEPNICIGSAVYGDVKFYKDRASNISGFTNIEIETFQEAFDLVKKKS